MDGEFELALARTRNPVLVADDDRRYVDCNEAALELLGMSREELLRLRVDDLFPPDRRSELDERWRQFLEQGGITGVDTLRLPGGREMTLRYGAVANASPGRHISIFLVGEDGAGSQNGKPALTAREREVLGLVAQGNTTRQIAERLVVSPTTIDTHIRSAMERLGARNRVHAVALALARSEVVLQPED